MRLEVVGELKERTGAREGDTRGLISLAVLFFAHYFQAPATQAKLQKVQHKSIEKFSRLTLSASLSFQSVFKLNE